MKVKNTKALVAIGAIMLLGARGAQASTLKPATTLSTEQSNAAATALAVNRPGGNAVDSDRKSTAPCAAAASGHNTDASPTRMDKSSVDSDPADNPYISGE
jgi:hypothetical protein